MDTLLTEIMIFMGTAGKLPNERGRSFDLKNIMAGQRRSMLFPIALAGFCTGVT
jgi:hypothetical protein